MVTLKSKVNKSLALPLCGSLLRHYHHMGGARDFLLRVDMKPRKLVFGVGNNNAGYAVTKYGVVEVNGVRKRKQVWICPYYRVWTEMLRRCYYDKAQERNPTYRGCSVSEEWLTFSNFKAWMEKQEWEGLELDKDVLIPGNNVYDPETCVFVTRVVNMFTTDSGAARGKWLIGVSFDKEAEKFKSRCHNPFTSKREYLGYFTCEQEAHEAWRNRKLELANELAAIQTDPRVAEALINRYSKPQERLI